MTGTFAESRKRNSMVAQEYSEGASVAELSEKYGLCRPYVATIARRAGVYERVSDRRVARLQEYACQGLTAAEVAEIEGTTRSSIYNMATRYGVKLAKAKRGRPRGEVGVKDVERANAMVAMFRAGRTLQDIGDLYSVSRERVRQVIKKHGGITGVDGGQAKKSAEAQSERKAAKEAACREKYGCSLKELAFIRKLGREHRANGGSWYTTPMGAFVNQRNNAKARGIEWGLKLWDWWTIWQESGRWDQRGRSGDAYVMCRFADHGPYARGNVYIATLRHNSTLQPNNPYRLSHPDHEKVAARRSSRRLCSVEGCDNHHYGRSYCRSHYYHFVIKVGRVIRQEAEAA